ncbi:FtsX-like permease family protein [Sphingosinicella sp. CPCC 101087]|uniref:FtsX-like permease family protein n=1 Tax=Sphingosinicella sp. CPCC 101087 TaxID=2497754 RepID=UPI00101DEDA7|nr:FtsX-like permease family protein [Sphingosinicella sp. CPCC 101087]
MTGRGRAFAATRHYAVAFVRNLKATRLLSAISILGLAIGLTGAILMALVARDAFGFNDFVPGNDRIYLGASVLSAPGMPPNYDQSSNEGAALLANANPDVAAATRLAPEEVELRREGNATRAPIYWADPNVFDVLRLPVLHGNLATALGRPDGIVMTRSEALRHFGRDDPVGEAIQVAGSPMVLRAVLADLPANATDLESGIFASALAARSPLTREVAASADAFSIGVRTYLALRPGASPDQVEARLNALVMGLLPPFMREAYAMELVRIDRIALHEGFHPDARERVEIGSLVAALILFIAVANFINLSVALSMRRRREIGIRKACGASRGQIAVQFVGEAVATVSIAACLAAAAVELLLPAVNAFLDSHARFDYVEEPALILWLLLAVLLLGLLAGFYPALLLSSLPPIAVLKNEIVPERGRGLVRNALVTAQFAILIALIIAMAVVYQQRLYAMDEALRADVDQVLTVTAPCPVGFRQEVARLPGVEAVSCSGRELLTGAIFGFVEVRGQRVAADMVSMLPSNFALLHIAPVAGSLAALPADGEEIVSRIVINEAAAGRFGYASPREAIGQVLPVPRDRAGPDIRAEIVAVVPDFAFYSVESPIKPTLYLARPFHPGTEGLVTIRLAGREIPETLAAVDRLWRATGNPEPIDRAFVDEHLENLYRELVRSTRLFAIFAGVAAFLACLGLVALSISAAERRTKEIGIRKALGARTDQVLMLLLWQLGRPVLWANLLAWPVAWWAMREWLNGFAYHVPLRAWIFPAAGLVALGIALVCVGGQTWLVARQKPARALRYE